MPPAGRPRSGANRDLPPRLIRRVRRGRVRYYYQHPDRRQEPLGADFQVALKRWHAIHTAPVTHCPGTFAVVAAEFEAHGVKGLAVKTQSEYRLGLARLVRVFGAARLEDIQPRHVGQLLHELRDTPHQANRLRALLSRVFNWARSRGFTAAANPCSGVEGHREPRREVLITPAQFWAVYDAGDQVLRDWLRLDLMVGARVSDPLRLRREAVLREEGRRWLRIRAAKTDTVGRIELTGDLADLVDELLSRPRPVSGPWLLQDEHGQRITYPMLRKRFDEARAAAGTAWQMRDLRKMSLNQAATLEEARRRAQHADPRTTARHYELVIDAVPGRLPKR